MEPAPAAITRLLHQSQQGNKAAFDELMPVVYDQLYRLAGRRLASERRGHTLPHYPEIVHEGLICVWSTPGHRLERSRSFLCDPLPRVMRPHPDRLRQEPQPRKSGAVNMKKVPLDAAFDLGARFEF